MARNKPAGDNPLSGKHKLVYDHLLGAHAE